ncbi:hypothetical protein EU805_15635 [Salipiger sp. IMCC34102]|uniref:sulfotransferase family 2 domain-containing protein n=1 Tax=Salipiger sp. IMCC34102 TaxID=2510647 RepID=UPI00101C903B|nr:sulfotransferase family 2 domain-containing protein [Salipiger sp. IMCC34102]RYH01033.1 hypothetical protein EU805_15635 [Salipiger sp. IMCC34102]
MSGNATEKVGKTKARPGSRLAGTEEFLETDIHFLHIGKCAGTQIRNVSRQLKEQSADRRIVKHGHAIFLRDLPPQADYFFSIRDPISRFRSGFYSRKRKGAPRLYNKWSKYEKPVFAEFPHANDLAESLFAEGPLGPRAWAAIKSMGHTGQNQSDWFCPCGTFLDIRPPLWIIRQERFDEDLQTFLQVTGLAAHGASLTVSRDSLQAHANDYSDVPPLSDLAKANLRKWYVQDFEFYRMCDAWLDEMKDKPAGTVSAMRFEAS